MDERIAQKDKLGRAGNGKRSEPGGKNRVRSAANRVGGVCHVERGRRPQLGHWPQFEAKAARKKDRSQPNIPRQRSLVQVGVCLGLHRGRGARGSKGESRWSCGERKEGKKGILTSATQTLNTWIEDNARKCGETNKHRTTGGRLALEKRQTNESEGGGCREGHVSPKGNDPVPSSHPLPTGNIGVDKKKC